MFCQSMENRRDRELLTRPNVPSLSMKHCLSKKPLHTYTLSIKNVRRGSKPFIFPWQGSWTSIHGWVVQDWGSRCWGVVPGILPTWDRTQVPRLSLQGQTDPRVCCWPGTLVVCAAAGLRWMLLCLGSVRLSWRDGVEVEVQKNGGHRGRFSGQEQLEKTHPQCQPDINEMATVAVSVLGSFGSGGQLLGTLPQPVTQVNNECWETYVQKRVFHLICLCL